MSNNNNKLVKYNQSVPSTFSRDEFLTPISSFFNDFFDEKFPVLKNGFFEEGSYPRCDISETDTSLELIAEIPGLDKSQVKVELNDDGVLSIAGEKHQETEDKKKNYVHKELKRSSFYRSFFVGDNIDKEKIDAKFDNGILTITLPKTIPTPKTEPKRIEIKSA